MVASLESMGREHLRTELKGTASEDAFARESGLVLPEISGDQNDDFGGKQEDEELFAPAGPSEIAPQIDFEIMDEGDRRRVERRQRRRLQHQARRSGR